MHSPTARRSCLPLPAGILVGRLPVIVDLIVQLLAVGEGVLGRLVAGGELLDRLEDAHGYFASCTGHVWSQPTLAAKGCGTATLPFAPAKTLQSVSRADSSREESCRSFLCYPPYLQDNQPSRQAPGLSLSSKSSLSPSRGPRGRGRASRDTQLRLRSQSPSSSRL